MVLSILRALFVLLMAAVGWFYLGQSGWIVLSIALALGVLFLALDVFSPRRKMSILAGTFFGLLVGFAIAYAFSFAVELIFDLATNGVPSLKTPHLQAVQQFIELMIGLICCYLSTSFVLQTKDDFRFIIPYVEFSKETKGSRSMLLDTSVLIDGRIAEIAETGILESQLIVPSFVLDELQAVADSGDRLKRGRGRRGLDILAKLRESRRADCVLYESSPPGDRGGVDHQLVDLARSLNARVLTTDFNLNKVARLSGVDVININDLSAAVRPVVVPGETMRVAVVKAGDEAGQGIGYLNDGTMVVIEQGRAMIGSEVDFTVTRALQTSAGRMIFGKIVTPSGEIPRPARSAGRAG